MRRTETPIPIWIKFCVVVDIPDVVTYTNFGDNRLRGFWVAGGQISPSFIDFHRRPYIVPSVPSCFRLTRYYHIRQLRCIRPYLDTKTASTTATSIVHSKLDYCNSLYHNLPKCQIILCAV